MEEQVTRQRVFRPCKEGEHGECAARVAQPHPRYLSGGRAILDIAECLCDCHDSEADAKRDVALRTAQEAPANAGCYVDSSRGIYSIDRIVEIAEAHGMATMADCGEQECLSMCDGPHDWPGCIHSHEIEDECDDYMNDHHGVDGCYWGRNENGDWGLWAIEDES